MAISNIGVGSGLDLQSLLDSLETNASASLTPIKNQQTAYNSKLSAYGTIKSVLAAYQAAAQALSKGTAFTAAKASVADEKIVTATVDASASLNKYNINVTQLAAAQTLASTGVADQKAAVGTGTITFDFGPDLATGGAPTSTKTVTISGDGSLESIRDSINKAGIGVSASIINDGSGTPYRLVLTANDTGTQSAMRVSASDSAVSNIVAFDPTQTTQPNGMQETVKAADAKLTINNIAITSHSNLVDSAAQGIQLTLNDTGTTSVTVSRDVSAVKDSVEALVTAYNNVLTAAAKLSSFVPADKPGDASTSGPLTGDSTLRSIQSSMRAMLNQGFPDGQGGTTTLSAFGISFNLDPTSKTDDSTGAGGSITYGQLEIDDDKLNAAIKNNSQALTAAFVGVDGKKGLGQQVSDFVDGLNATNGTLKVATDGVTSTLKDLDQQLTNANDHITAMMDTYRAQFSNLDLLITQMNSTKSYLTQQFAQLSNSSSK